MTESTGDKRALVTGGTSGIGRAVARALAGEGYRVTATGVTDAEVAEFRAEERDLAASTLDVTDAAQVRHLVERFERLDVLVNCAGIIRRDGREFDPAEFADVVDVNLVGTMRMCAACRPLLADRGGCIVNTASMSSFFGSGFVPGYSASKGGVAQLTKSLAIAWAAEGIRVNAVAPGWIVTAMTEPLTNDENRSRALIERTPMKRWGKPEDVAGAVVFLCSAAAAFITGVVLPVDGGYSIA